MKIKKKVNRFTLAIEKEELKDNRKKRNGKQKTLDGKNGNN